MGELYDIAIIGSGGAGQMAILRAVLNHLKTLAFMGDAKTTKRSRHTWVHEVENIPGMFDLKRPISSTTKGVLNFIEGRENLKPFLTTLKKSVTQISQDDQGFELKTDEEKYRARYVILCTGTMDVQPHIGGSIEPVFPYANRGEILYCIRCDGHKTYKKKCAVIGHTDSAAWNSILLKERYEHPQCWILSNGKAFEGSDKVKKILDQYKIPVLEGEIQKILGDPKEKLEGFQVDGQQVPAEVGIISLGSIVHNELAKQIGVELNEREHLMTNPVGETSVPGFYAAGDLVAGKKKQVYTAWDMAVDAVDHIDGRVRKLKREAKY